MSKFNFYTPSDTNIIIQASSTVTSVTLGDIDDDFSKVVIINKGSADLYYDFVEANLQTGSFSGTAEETSAVLPSDFVEMIDYIEVGEPSTIYLQTTSGTADVIIKRVQ